MAKVQWCKFSAWRSGVWTVHGDGESAVVKGQCMAHWCKGIAWRSGVRAVHGENAVV